MRIQPELKCTFSTWDEASTFVAYQVFDTAQEQEQLTVNHVLLDNGVDVSVFHPDLLRDVQKNTVKIKVNILGDRQLLLTDEGYLPDFLTVYASKPTKVNILSLADAEVVYPITYNPCISFTMHIPWLQQLCTRAKIKNAKEAYAI
jgi:hypothetical protein